MWQLTHEEIKILRMQASLEGDTNTANHLKIVFRFFLRIEKVWIVVQDGFHVEGIDTKNFIQGGSTLFGFHDGRELVDGGQSIFQNLLLLFRYQVDLVEQNLVGKGNLLQGLVGRSVGFLFVQVQVQVLAIGQANDRIDVVVFGHFRVGLDRVDDGCRIGQSRRFEQNSIKVLAAFRQLTQGSHQISTDLFRRILNKREGKRESGGCYR